MDIDTQSQDMAEADAALQTSTETARLSDVADLLSKMKFAKWADIYFWKFISQTIRYSWRDEHCDGRGFEKIGEC